MAKIIGMEVEKGWFTPRRRVRPAGALDVFVKVREALELARSFIFQPAPGRGSDLLEIEAGAILEEVGMFFYAAQARGAAPVLSCATSGAGLDVRAFWRLAAPLFERIGVVHLALTPRFSPRPRHARA